MFKLKKVTAAPKFDSKKSLKDVQYAIEEMNSNLMNIAMIIDEAEEASPYKMDRISIDKTISIIDSKLDNLSTYAEKILKNLKTEL